jgi:hypothetical protein
MPGFTEDPEWRERIATDVRGLLDRLSGQVLENAQRAVPVETGHLRDSLRRGIEGTTAHIGSDLNYSVYVEEGHRVAYRNAEGVVVYTGEVVPPQPYLRPALYALQADAGAVIEETR